MRRTFVVGFLSLFTAACGTADETRTSTTGTSPSSEPDASADDDDDDDDDEDDDDSTDGGAGMVDASREPIVRRDSGPNLCESRTIHALAVPPDVLIVLDKSLSMLAGNRWDPSRVAVETLVSEFQEQIAFGLSMFPAGDLGQCDPGVMDVPLELDNADAITQRIDGALPFGITPTAQTLENALMFMGDRTMVADSAGGPPGYVLLVTDGEPNCADLTHINPVQSSIDAVEALRDANVKTFVIGYDLFGLGAGLMDQLAQAGGTDHYYAVESQADLTEAFHAITQGIVSCTFELSEVPPDPAYVRVVLDGQTVTLDSADGWKIEGKVVTLQGGSCKTLRNGEQHELQSQVECMPVTVL